MKEIDIAIQEIKASNLFDEAYYLKTNKDVKNNPIGHFLLYGAKERRNPSAEFDVSFYLEKNPDVKKSDFNPLIHYIRHGKSEGRRPCPPKYFLTMATCIKNEAKYLDEWLCYYIYQGVEHFYLNNDESTDNTREILQPYIEQGYITLYEGLRKQGILQGDFYYKIIEEKRYESEWCCFYDVDEFYQGEKLLSDFLSTLNPTVSGIELFWKFYGSAGLEKYDERFVIERFNQHRTIDYNPKDYVKSICRLINTKPTKSTHTFHYTKGIVINAKIEDITNIPEHIRVASLPLIWEKAWINHYYYKSREEYVEKITKGDVTNFDDKLRIDVWSHGGNRNDVIDDSMKDYCEKIQEIIKKIKGK